MQHEMQHEMQLNDDTIFHPGSLTFLNLCSNYYIIIKNILKKLHISNIIGVKQMKNSYLAELQESLTSYFKSGFIFDRLFIRDLKDILDNHISGNKKQFFNLLIKQLNYVNDLRRRVNEANSNEVLKNTNTNYDLYSLHLRSQHFNIRFLITFSGDDTPLFLLAFYEKSGKRRSSYSAKIEEVKKRYERREKDEHEP